MRKVGKRTLTKSIKDERGQALMLVLILLLLGSLIIAPMLAHISTGLKVGEEVYEEKMYRLYAADSGVEDALWEIKNEQLSTLPGFGSYDQYKYSAYSTSYNWQYNPEDIYAENVNDKNVTVTMENVWMPKDIPAPSPSEAEDIIKGTGGNPPSLIIVGSLSGTAPSTYQISIDYYYGSSDPTGANLKVKTIGIWLPPGFGYDDSAATNCSLYNGTATRPYSTPTVSDYKSGKAVVWNFSSAVPLANFPGSGGTGSPMVRGFTFKYKADTANQSPGAAVSWIDTSGVSGVTYAWDANTKIYKILSTAKDNPDTGKQVEVEAYAAKIEMRQMGTAMSGDYVAIGNSLMMIDTSDPTFRNRLLKESDATIQDSNSSNPGYIPQGATVEGAYLYWSGWIDRYYWRKSAGAGNWSWMPSPDAAAGGIPALNYNNYTSNPSLLVTNAKVNTVSFGAGGVTQDITATQWAVYPKMNDSDPSGIENCWYYTCLDDVTDLQLSDGKSVKQHIEEAIGSSGSGTYTFTLGHASQGATSVINLLRSGYLGPNSTINGNYYGFYLYDKNGNQTSNYTGYPLGTPAHELPGTSSYNGRYNASYAGWSLVIIYSTPDMEGHQLYLYDISNPNFTFTESFQSDMDFDGDGTGGGKVSGFLVPPQIQGETIAAKITCFMGEGDDDSGHSGDFIAFNAPSQYTDTYSHSLNIPDSYKLWDGKNSVLTPNSNTSTHPCNVWNSMSVGLNAPGVDIDTFYIPWQTGGSVPYGNPNFNGLLHQGDTSARINLPSPNDGVTMSYIILSFRSEITYGGTISYLVRG
jgi:hypothetical protein